ncbi:MAG: ATP synthase F1 subunit delta [Bacteroidia bacterium]|nr:ATP synthase F1 subunit delta [Bacteroidia bacterium]
MSETKISNRYAQALMQQANADNKLSVVASDMALISSTCHSSKDLSNALKNPIINPPQKLNAILAIFSKADKSTQDFLKLVCSRNRENILPDIAEAFLNLYRKAQGIEKVMVQSASAISESDKKSIESYVQKHTGAKSVEMHTEINPSVIGGLVIKFGDNLLDTSIAAKLRKLKKELNIA